MISISPRLLRKTIPSEIGLLKHLTQLELELNGLSGLFSDELLRSTNLKILNVGYQVFNPWNCTRSDGTYVSVAFSMGDEENEMNLGLKGEILGSRIGDLEYLKELSINDNNFSGEIGSFLHNR